MSQMKQLALDISMAPGPTLARFFVGPNAALIDHLRHWVGDGQLQQSRTPVPTYLWGEAGSGKSHLLKAVREALREQGPWWAGWMHPHRSRPSSTNAGPPCSWTMWTSTPRSSRRVPSTGL
jgi:DnaA family protein